MWNKFKKWVREECCDHCWHKVSTRKVKVKGRCRRSKEEYIWKDDLNLIWFNVMRKDECCVCGKVKIYPKSYGYYKNNIDFFNKLEDIEENPL